MGNIVATPVLIEVFTFHKETNTLVGYASEIPGPTRIWDDACDYGYVIRGRYELRVFVPMEGGAGSVRDEDGDIISWVYEEYARYGKLDHSPVRLLIFND